MTSQHPRQLLCLTMLGYMKPGLSEEELCDFQVTRHARLVSGLMEKYGIVRYTITHNTKKTRALMSKLFDPRFVEFSDHDFVVRIIFPEVENFLKLKADPVYNDRIAKDHLNFANMQNKTKMTLGYVHEIINEGEVTYPEDDDAVLCEVNNLTFDVEQGVFKKQDFIDNDSGAMARSALREHASEVHV